MTEYFVREMYQARVRKLLALDLIERDGIRCAVMSRLAEYHKLRGRD
jgi:hypothetical protein